MSFNPAQLIGNVMQHPIYAQNAHSGGPLGAAMQAGTSLAATGAERYHQWQRGREFQQAGSAFLSGDIVGAVQHAFTGIGHHVSAAQMDQLAHGSAGAAGSVVNGTPPWLQNTIDTFFGQGAAQQAGPHVANGLHWLNNKLTV